MKKCLIVLGMHRSGTSALMGVLKAFSVEIGSGGSGFIKPSFDNQKGFFELLDIVNLNDRIFGSLLSSWDSLYALPENWWKVSGIDEYRKEISAVIKTNFDDSGITSIKDPRLCRLLPLWSEVFEELGVRPFFIIPLRNPLEIANSLKTRDGFSLEKSLLLWMTYMLDAELHSRTYPRVFITYDGLLRDTANTIGSVSRTLNIEFPKSYQDCREEIAQFLDSGMKHHNQDAASVKNALSEDIFRFYGLLSGLVGKEAASGEVLSEIDQLRNRYYDPDGKVFYNRDVINLITERERALAEKELAIAEKERAIAKYESRLIYIPSLKKSEQKIRRKIVYPIKNLLDPSPKIFCNSIPKSGTHLLAQIFLNLGFKITSNGEIRPWMTLEETENKLSSLKKKEYIVGHRHYDKEFNSLIKKNGISHVLIVRDPRDVIVSKAFYITKTPEHGLSYYFNNLDSRERFIAAINGVPGKYVLKHKEQYAVPGIVQIYKDYLPWLNDDNCLVTKFEDLIGSRGGGSDEKQSETLRRIAGHLGISFDESELKEVALKSFNKNSLTFRKGKIGDWSNWLDDEMLGILKKDEAVFKEFGYTV
jgi:Sulfotransferase domain